VKRADGQSDACLIRLPVNGLAITVRHPTGREDILLREAGGDDTALALALAERLAQTSAGTAPDWPGLAVTDLDTFILRLRQFVIGDLVRADIACRAPGCTERIDISFGIDQYLMHHQPSALRPRGGWNVEPTDENGWFRLIDVRQGARTEPMIFRVPTVGDQLALAGCADPAAELARRCLRPDGVPARLRRRAEASMERMAPALSGELRGACPQCGAEVTVNFEARQYCLRELRDRAAFIYQEVDLLARRYHWTESDILDLPHVRRMHYVELARQEGGRG